MTDENKTEQTTELKQEDLIKIIEDYSFMTNPVRFNASLFNGIRIMLENQKKVLDVLEQINLKLNKNG